METKVMKIITNRFMVSNLSYNAKRKFQNDFEKELKRVSISESFLLTHEMNLKKDASGMRILTNIKAESSSLDSTSEDNSTPLYEVTGQSITLFSFKTNPEEEGLLNRLIKEKKDDKNEKLAHKIMDSVNPIIQIYVKSVLGSCYISGNTPLPSPLATFDIKL